MADRFVIGYEPKVDGIDFTYQDLCGFWEKECKRIASEANKEHTIMSARIEELRHVIALMADGIGDANTIKNVIDSLAKENKDLRARLSLLDDAEFPASGV